MASKPPAPRTRRPQGSKSATVRAAAASPSRRQLSHWEQERQKTRLLWIGSAALVLVVVLILAGGWVYDNVVQANQVVATVYGQNITASQVVAEMQPDAHAIDVQSQALAGSASQSAIAQQILQQKLQLPDQALDALVQALIIEHEAQSRGITVSDQEVSDRLRQDVSTAEFLATPQPTATETPQGAAASPSPEGATATPTAPTTPTPVPTLADPAYQDALKRQLDRIGMTEDRYRVLVRRDLLQQKVQDAIGAQVPTSQEQIHARHIVVADQATATDTLSKLQGGADFAQLAQQVSTDTSTKDKGGDLGWIPRGIESPQFDQAAFALQPGQTSDPVQTPAGYEIIQVLEHDPNRPVAPDQLTRLKSAAYSDWLQSQQTGPDVKMNFTPDEHTWALSRIGVRSQ